MWFLFSTLHDRAPSFICSWICYWDRFAALFLISASVFAHAFRRLVLCRVHCEIVGIIKGSNMRFVCLDFETNGFFDENLYVLPWTNYPIQVSLTAVEDGTVTHLYDSLIRGALSCATWVSDNVPIKMSDLEYAPELTTVLQEIAARLHPDDFIVAHKARFDMEQCLRRSAKKLGMRTRDLDFILGLPRFCTQNCEYVKSTLAFRERRLSNLCEHLVWISTSLPHTMRPTIARSWPSVYRKLCSAESCCRTFAKNTGSLMATQSFSRKNI